MCSSNTKPLLKTSLAEEKKCIQSDMGGEYRSFGEFVKQHMIDFRHPCPRTSAQNGRPNRKHRLYYHWKIVYLKTCSVQWTRIPLPSLVFSIPKKLKLKQLFLQSIGFPLLLVQPLSSQVLVILTGKQGNKAINKSPMDNHLPLLSSQPWNQKALLLCLAYLWEPLLFLITGPPAALLHLVHQQTHLHIIRK